MTEENEQDVEESPREEPEGPVGGERLAEARRERQISVLEIAKELHLDEAKVRALERNEFDVLGAPVFAKGHLRKYAQLVGVDEDDVFVDYYRMTHTAELPPVVIGRPKIRREISPGPWIAAIVVIIAAAIAYWWFAAGPDIAGPVIPPVVAPQAEQSVDALSQTIEETIDDALPDQQMPSAEPVAVPAEAEPADDGLTTVSLSFSGDCWTEISDANGQRLFFEMGRAGREVDLTGTAPFSVLFGNVENVSVRVDGREYPVSSSNPGSRTARLRIIKP